MRQLLAAPPFTLPLKNQLVDLSSGLSPVAEDSVVVPVAEKLKLRTVRAALNNPWKLGVPLTVIVYPLPLNIILPAVTLNGATTFDTTVFPVSTYVIPAVLRLNCVVIVVGIGDVAIAGIM
jgi:hypothetical protein